MKAALSELPSRSASGLMEGEAQGNMHDKALLQQPPDGTPAIVVFSVLAPIAIPP